MKSKVNLQLDAGVILRMLPYGTCRDNAIVDILLPQRHRTQRLGRD